MSTTLTLAGLHVGLVGVVQKKFAQGLFQLSRVDEVGSKWCGVVHKSEIGDWVPSGKTVSDHPDGQSDKEGGGNDE